MIVAIASQKGGVGKTTSTICLGGLLTKSTSCLAIDLDPQGNLTTGLGIEVADGQFTTYEVLTERSTVDKALVATKSGLNLLPADISLAQGEPEISNKVGNFYLLREQLEPVKPKFAHILIDCPPILGLLTVNGLAAADAVLIPVQCQFFALKGLAALLETIASVRKRLNPDLQILGVLPTMAENTLMTQDILTSLKKRLGDTTIFSPVPKSIRFPESNLAGEPIHLYSNEPKYIKPYGAIASIILRDKK